MVAIVPFKTEEIARIYERSRDNVERKQIHHIYERFNGRDTVETLAAIGDTDDGTARLGLVAAKEKHAPLNLLVLDSESNVPH